MKYFATIFFFLAVTMTLEAQTERGTFIGGLASRLDFNASSTNTFGGLAIGTTKLKSDNEDGDDEERFVAFNLNPRMGVFVIDNLAMGADLSWSHSRTSEDFDGDEYITNNSAITAGPFIRYYLPTTIGSGAKSRMYVESSGSWGQLKFRSDYNGGEDEIKYGMVNYGAAAGISSFFGKRFALDVQVGYEYFHLKIRQDNPDNLRTVQNGLALNFGFSYFLFKKPLEGTTP